MRLRRDQAGFTLLELLVSVAILAIVVIPIGMVFVTSARINATAKEKQRQKFAATNVVEDIRSQSIKNIIKSPNTKQRTKTDSKSGKTTNVYYYCGKEVVDGKTYYVEAELDPNQYDDTSTSINEDTDYNAKEYAELYNMNSAYDAFCEFTTSSDETAVNEIVERAYLKDKSFEAVVKQNIYRDINIRIDKADNTTNVYASAYYKYMKGGSKLYEYETTEQCIYSDVSGENLRGIYVFYAPLYKINSKNIGHENIYITNNAIFSKKTKKTESGETEEVTRNKYTVYLVEQYDTTNDKNNQKAYKVNINLMENRGIDDVFSSDSVVTAIRTNIDTDLRDYLDSEKIKSKTKLTLKYSLGSGNYAESIQRQDSKKLAGQIMDLNNLVGSKQTNVVYKLVARVYTEDEWNKHKGFVDGTKDDDGQSSYKLETTTQ